MKNDYVHICIILDRSGSMSCIKNDIIGGFNTLIEEQQKLPGTATMTLVQFDTQDPYEVIYDFTNIVDIKPLTDETFVPRGATPLLDAVGMGITDCGERLAGMDEADRPSKVLFTIITDGQENSSTKYTKDKVQELIQHQTDVYKWEFMFLSSDFNAIYDARQWGINDIHGFTATASGCAVMYQAVCDTYSTARMQ